MDPSRYIDYYGHVRRGVRRVVNVSQPNPGAEWVAVVPGGVNWRVLVGSSIFTTSAAVVNRVASMQVSIDGVQVWRGGNAGSYAASSAIGVTFMASDSPSFNAGANNPTSQAIPNVPLPPGAVIGSRTGAIDAGDQYSAIVLWIEEMYFTDQSLTEEAQARYDRGEHFQHELAEAIQHAT